MIARLTTLATLVVLLGGVGGAGADERQDTQTALERTVDQGIAILLDKTLDDAGKLARFDAVMEDGFHLELVARLTLGRAWSRFDPDQRQQFVIEFRNMIKRSYYDKVARIDLNGIAVDYRSNEPSGKDRRNLKAIMKAGNASLEVVYKYYLQNDRWGVYDVEVDGVSLVSSYRAQFADFLATRQPAELLAEMRRNDNSFGVEDNLDRATPEK